VHAHMVQGAERELHDQGIARLANTGGLPGGVHHIRHFIHRPRLNSARTLTGALPPRSCARWRLQGPNRDQGLTAIFRITRIHQLDAVAFLGYAANLAGLQPRLQPEQLSEVRAVMLSNNKKVMTEMAQRSRRRQKEPTHRG